MLNEVDIDTHLSDNLSDKISGLDKLDSINRIR